MLSTTPGMELAPRVEHVLLLGLNTPINSMSQELPRSMSPGLQMEIESESCLVNQLGADIAKRTKVILEDGKSLPVLTCISGRNFDTHTAQPRLK